MICRACNSERLFLGIDLGQMPLSLGLVEGKDSNAELFETKMLICKECGHGMLSKDVEPEKMFSYYTYKTSVSKSFLDHSKRYFDKYSHLVSQGEWVLELASNDGYMLNFFVEAGIDCLGVEPAKNLAEISISNGIKTINEFFNSKLAQKILNEKGFPKLIIANNVFAHVPDIQDFAKGIAILCGEDTLISVENPTIMNMLNKYQFDTIFHEHYSYLSCNSVSRIFDKLGLRLYDVEDIDTQGGSNRYWISKPKSISKRLADKLDQEVKDGLFNPDAWRKFAHEVDNKMNEFHEKINSLRNSGAVICGYAASSKATIQLNYNNLYSGGIVNIADDGEEKIGKYLPGVNIPIVSTQDMYSAEPTDIIVFPWNIFDEIKDKINRDYSKEVNVWSWFNK